MPALDLLIRGGTALTLTDARPRILPAVIGIRDGLITLLEEESAPESRSDLSAAETLDASGTIILPGLVNTHTHLPMTLFRGLADDLPLMEWLNRHIFPAEARHVRPDTVYAGALLALAEMILSERPPSATAAYEERAQRPSTPGCGDRGRVPRPPPAGRTPRPRCAGGAPPGGRASPSPASSSIPTLLTRQPDGRKRRRHYGALCCIMWRKRGRRLHVRERYGTTPVRHLHRLGVLTTDPWFTSTGDEEEMTILRRGGRLPPSGECMSFCRWSRACPGAACAGIPVGWERRLRQQQQLDLFEKWTPPRSFTRSGSTTRPSWTPGRSRNGHPGVRCRGPTMHRHLTLGSAADLIIVELKNKPHLTPVQSVFNWLCRLGCGRRPVSSTAGSFCGIGRHDRPPPDRGCREDRQPFDRPDRIARQGRRPTSRRRDSP